MIKINPQNERIKKEYFTFLKEANQKSQATIDVMRSSIKRFEVHTDFISFKAFNKSHAVLFKKELKNTLAVQTGKPLSNPTILKTLKNLQAFFNWLCFDKRYKSHINKMDIEYFNLSEKDIRAATAQKYKKFPSLEQIKTALFSMKGETEIQRRDKAIFAFLILTGMRDMAIVSLKLKHIDIQNRFVNQDPNEVKTKFSKQINTFFFPVGEEILKVFVEWVEFLRNEKRFSENDPVFPQTQVGLNESAQFSPVGLVPIHWSTAEPIRKLVKQAFKDVGIEYFTPHLFRHTLVHIGQEMCTSPEEFKAFSQNLGHESPLTTFTSYGQIRTDRQGELIKGMAKKKSPEAMMEEMFAWVKSKS